MRGTAMQSPIDKRGLTAYLTALSLSLALFENALPRVMPFLRLGLSNIPLLLALSMLSAKDYAMLALSKAVLSALSQGTLFSEFFLLSLSSGIASGFVMYAMHKLLGKHCTLYSVSALGSAASSVAQVFSSSLFLSESVLMLMPYAILLGTLTGVFTAYVASKVRIPSDFELEETKKAQDAKSFTTLIIFIAALFSLALMGTECLAISFLLLLMMQKASGRKIRASIYAMTFISVVLFNLFTPNGRVLFSFITEGSLLEGTKRALRLISMVSLSQVFASLKINVNSYVSSVFRISGELFSSLTETKWNLKDGITLQPMESQKRSIAEKKANAFIYIGLAAITVLMIVEKALAIG